VGSGDSSLIVFDKDSSRLMEYSGTAWRGIRYTNESAVTSAGEYTPTLTSGTNVDLVSNSYSVRYIRVGNIVTVTGTVNLDPTATGIIVYYVSLPIASNFTSINDAHGPCGGSGSESYAGMVGLVSADFANDRLQVSYAATTTDQHASSFTVSYTVK
jgi:hypothetical protein